MNDSTAKIAMVVTGLPVDKTFHYDVPEAMQEKLKPGMRVLVPFGKRKVTGYVVGFAREAEVGELKEIISILDQEPYLTPQLLDLTRWIADSYFCSWGEAITASLPSGLSFGSKAFVQIAQRGRERLAAGPSREWERTILMLLIQSDSFQVSRLRERLKLPNLTDKLRTMEREGLVSVSERVVRAGVTSRREKVAVAVKGTADLKASLPEEDRRFHAAMNLLKRIWSEERVQLSLLTKEKGGRSALRWLDENGFIRVGEEEVYRDPYAGEIFSLEPPFRLTEGQERAAAEIWKEIDAGRHSIFLLHGVTGSGKTEVYIRAAERAFKRGRQSIILVPEIALTPRLMELFRTRFGDRAALTHSGLSQGERYDEWRRMLRGEVSVVVGARSAVLAPMDRLGLIVIDEEHETSYKQEEAPRYHAREVAIQRAREAGAVVILGTATPSTESFHNYRAGLYGYISMPERIGSRPMPQVEVVDMKEEVLENGQRALLSRRLREAMEERLRMGEQVLLFLNRRGFYTYMQCMDCGAAHQCPNCSVTLTYHAAVGEGICHYCGYSARLRGACPNCKGTRIFYGGMGTQRVEEEVKAFFPEARVSRMDRDTTRRKHAHSRILQRVHKREIDVLVGTQMVAKGLDFPNITLAGVISADTSLNIPDFRASERTFQLITQVSGRTGRGPAPGLVIIQTYRPQHYAIECGIRQDFLDFYEKEMIFRETLDYPPASRLVRVVAESIREEKAASAMEELAERLHALASGREGIEVLGPAVPVIPRIKNRHRFHIMLKGEPPESLRDILRQGLERLGGGKRYSGVRIKVDVDPINMF